MKYWPLFIVVSSVFANPILEELDTDISPEKSFFEASNVNFLVCTHPCVNIKAIKNNFLQYKINLNIYDKFAKYNEKLLTKHCSANTSPYILKQVLSHLSIYQYCLDNDIKTALIVDDQAHIAANPDLLNNVYRLFFHTSLKTWDFLFTDFDYHNPETGEYITPTHDSLPSKYPFRKTVNKVNFRYGVHSYIISQSGMRKLLNMYIRNNEIIPLDRAIVHCVKLKRYAPKFDIITNKHNKTPIVPQTHTIENWQVGDKMWVSPNQLLKPDRFDTLAKFIYVKYSTNGYNTDWHLRLYKAHLENWINFYNVEPLKLCFNDFKQHFDKTLDSILQNGFSDKYPVPVNMAGNLMDGSHRAGICLALSKPIYINIVAGTDSPKMLSNSFKSEYLLDTKYLDHMALEYIKLKENARVICIEANNTETLNSIREFANKSNQLVYEKTITFSESGLERFNEEIGVLCEKHFLSPTLTFLTIDSNNIQSYENFFKSDTVAFFPDKISSFIAASTAYNQNSINFMNTKRKNSFPGFDLLLEQFLQYATEQQLSVETCCVDSGGVMAAYGIRNTKDIDLIHSLTLPQGYQTAKIDSHNLEAQNHIHSKDDIIFNPENHFYYKGIKFICLDLVKKMKLKRNSEKDKKDVKLINAFFKNN